MAPIGYRCWSMPREPPDSWSGSALLGESMPELPDDARARIPRRPWPSIVAWGVVVCGIGVAILAVPTLTVTVLVMSVGLLSLIAGMSAIGGALALRGQGGAVWALSFVPGVFLVAAGVFAIVRADIVSGFFAVIAALLALAWGAADITAGFASRPYLRAWWVRLVRGGLVAFLALIVVFKPPAGIAGMGWLLGLWAVAVGLTTIWFGLTLRRV
jgi:uncharacterized membrane protein HdeD (DUF308 family)